MNFQTKLVDYDKVVTELMGGLKPLTTLMDGVRTSKSNAIRELRTITVRGLRQTGKTSYLIKKHLENEKESIFVIKAEFNRPFIEARFPEGFSKKRLINQGLFSRPNIEKLLNNEIAMVPSKSHQLLVKPKRKIKYVYVDDCDISYISGLFLWLEKHGTDDVVVLNMGH